MGVKLLIQVFILQVIMLLLIEGAFAQNTTNNRSVALPGCEERCGSLVVPYPLGIGENCSYNRRMVIDCDTSLNPPKAILPGEDLDLEVLNISIKTGTIRVNYPVTNDPRDKFDAPIVSLDEPFTFSNTENRFTAVGCNNLALLRSLSDKSGTQLGVGGCVSRCDPSVKKDNSCFGINCCQTQFPPSLTFLQASVGDVSMSSPGPGYSKGRRHAFIVEQNWFKNLKDIYSVQTMEEVPAVINWRSYGDCQSFTRVARLPNSTLCGLNTFCTKRRLCACRKGYEGNPYLPNGCQDIDECATYVPGSSLKRNRCEHYCTNKPGNYTCSCKHGWLLVDNFKCVKLEVDHRKKEADNSIKKATVIVIAACAGLGVLSAAIWWLYKVIRRRNIRKREAKFFERNGGLLLRQQVSSSQGNTETTKLFTSKELEKATDNYNVDRIVGQGGQGTVYKGMLTDGRIVAVKKSKIEDESKLEHFINEVVILSQINHRNVVKLHGCCLQTEVPLLVYEFIPNGTLMQYIHEENEFFPLTWDVRVRVATEIAGALFYLHSAASIPIYHRDIKSTNILLDDKYRAKVADFGTSRSFSIDQTHLTTRVQGTFGYLDPEYFQSSQFTDKSDVYSFGVVLVELLTGQKPILAARLDDEARGLATLFLLAMEENRIFDILDSRITNVGRKEEMMAFANIAYRCLNLNGRKRPTMKQVVVELESIGNTQESTTAQQNYEEVECGKQELKAPWESDVTSSSMSSTEYHILSVDRKPLMTI